MDDLHTTPAQHVGWSHHQRETDLSRTCDRIQHIAGSTIRWLFQIQFAQHRLEACTVFRHVDHIDRRADDGHAALGQTMCQLQRCLPTVLHDDANWFFHGNDFQHIFQCQRFEIQAIRSVVVGGNRLGIAVDHDGLVAVFAHRQRGMHTAIVELDTLPDTVRPAAQHHDLLVIGR